MLSIARSLAMVASNNTVVFQFGPDHEKLLFLGGGAWLFGIANPVIYMLALTLLTGFVLHFTRFGRYVFAIGGNEHAAIVTGVPVRRTKVAVYMISALSAGIAGAIGHQRVLARHLRRLVHYHCRGLRPDPEFPVAGVSAAGSQYVSTIRSTTDGKAK
jgi:ribose/xylose/arabinose/galactoside ABC-type transport system permease subunit